MAKCYGKACGTGRGKYHNEPIVREHAPSGNRRPLHRSGDAPLGRGLWRRTLVYTDRLLVTGFTYTGQRYDDVHISIALANSGDVQLELIQQRCNTPTMYRDFLAAENEGMQHWSSWPENYDEIYHVASAISITVPG
jgi:hypothetical protein